MTINEDAHGYVYIFDAKDFVKSGNDIQYIFYTSITPLDIIKVYYKDYKHLFKFKNKKIKT